MDDERASPANFHNKTLDVYGITVHTGHYVGLTCTLPVFATRGSSSSAMTGAQKGFRLRWPTSSESYCSPSKTAETLEQLRRFPGWKLHPLKGDLKGFWSLTATGNWRLIFRYDDETNTARDIDLIDYH